MRCVVPKQIRTQAQPIHGASGLAYKHSRLGKRCTSALSLMILLTEKFILYYQYYSSKERLENSEV